MGSFDAANPPNRRIVMSKVALLLCTLLLGSFATVSAAPGARPGPPAGAPKPPISVPGPPISVPGPPVAVPGPPIGVGPGCGAEQIDLDNESLSVLESLMLDRIEQ